jgi:hypothetical protein
MEMKLRFLSKLTEEQVEEKLDELDLDYVLLDSVNYKSDFPKFCRTAGSIAGRKVKGRKVYIKINSSIFISESSDLIEKRIVKQFPPKSIGTGRGTIMCPT